MTYLDPHKNFNRVAVFSSIAFGILLIMALIGVYAEAPPQSSDSSQQYLNRAVTREDEVRKMLRENLSPANYGHSWSSKTYLWPTERDAKKVFSQLQDTDIPILIEIIRTHDTREDERPGVTIDTAVYHSARWVLSFFKDKAEPHVLELYERATTSDEKEKWEGVLRTIKVRKSETPTPRR